MECWYPQKKINRATGEEIIYGCGYCPACRIKRANLWSARYVVEKEHNKNPSFFLTLTYNDEYVPLDYYIDENGVVFEKTKKDKAHEGGSLVQKFLKRWRKTGCELRYMLCTEFGPRTDRIHHHAIVFTDYDFGQQKLLKRNKYGDGIFESKKLDSLWKYGYVTLAPSEIECANYLGKELSKQKRVRLYASKGFGKQQPAEEKNIIVKTKKGIKTVRNPNSPYSEDELFDFEIQRNDKWNLIKQFTSCTFEEYRKKKIEHYKKMFDNQERLW